MHNYVEVAVNVPSVSGIYHYQIPDNLQNQLVLGHLVQVPFGTQTVQGVVMGFAETSPVENTKTVIDLIDKNAALTSAQMQFARELADSSLASLASCIELMLPPGLAQQADVLYTPLVSGYTGQLSEAQKRLLSLLEKRGPLRGQQIDRSLSRMNWRPAAHGKLG